MATTILVVEDDVRNRKLMSDLLGVSGYTVIEAPNGKVAVDLLRDQRPDLILMDMQMPIMDGYMATQQIKADAATRTIPIWALTSYAMPGDEEEIRAVGCDAYITKPINTRDFLQRLARHFGKEGV